MYLTCAFVLKEFIVAVVAGERKGRAPCAVTKLVAQQNLKDVRRKA